MTTAYSNTAQRRAWKRVASSARSLRWNGGKSGLFAFLSSGSAQCLTSRCRPGGGQGALRGCDWSSLESATCSLAA